MVLWTDIYMHMYKQNKITLSFTLQLFGYSHDFNIFIHVRTRIRQLLMIASYDDENDFIYSFKNASREDYNHTDGQLQLNPMFFVERHFYR